MRGDESMDQDSGLEGGINPVIIIAHKCGSDRLNGQR